MVTLVFSCIEGPKSGDTFERLYDWVPDWDELETLVSLYETLYGGLWDVISVPL
jgi:hypothetical protein